MATPCSDGSGESAFCGTHASSLLPGCDEFHSVPSGFWKIVAVDDLGTLRIAAFIMDQDTARNSRVIDHLESVDTVQRRSGLDFFWQLPDAEQDVLEAGGNAALALTWAN